MNRYWRVKLREDLGAIKIEGWVRFVPAVTSDEAGTKAIAFRQKKTPGAEPSIIVVEEELHVGLGPISIQIEGLDSKPPSDLRSE